MNEKLGKRTLLDCTLRDGGYINNWEFSEADSIEIIQGLYDSGIRNIEIGIMGKNQLRNNTTKFNDFSQMEPLLQNRKTDCEYALMINQSDADSFAVPKRSEVTVDIIRIAFFKDECDAAIKKAYEIKKKGYKVFLQAMATFMYSDCELEELINKVNDLVPDAFYIVDSFSTLYNNDVRRMRDLVLSLLSEDIAFGLHAHNNIQMAVSNVIAFFEADTKRELYADGSIYGMGRGAGNAPIELLMEYMSKKYSEEFHSIEILKTYENNLKKTYEKYMWGFLHKYMLTATKDMNSAYSWYLDNLGINRIEEYDDILNLIPDEKKYKLSKEDVQRILKEKEGIHYDC